MSIYGIISIALIFLSGLMKGLRDFVAFKTTKNRPENTWKNKYSEPLKPTTVAPWYYMWIYKPSYKEKYPYSSTLLVFLTDKWHLYESIRGFLVSSSISIMYTEDFSIKTVCLIVIVQIIRVIGFHSTYTTMKRQ